MTSEQYAELGRLVVDVIEHGMDAIPTPPLPRHHARRRVLPNRW